MGRGTKVGTGEKRKERGRFSIESLVGALLAMALCNGRYVSRCSLHTGVR